MTTDYTNFADQYAPAGGFGGMPQDVPQPIGGDLAPSDHKNELVRMTSGYGTSFSGYFEGEEFSLLRGLPTEQRARLQDQMMALGIASSTVRGEIDAGTLAGFRSLLSMANSSGTDWQQTLSRVQRTAEQTGTLGPKVPDQVYMAPDYATMSQAVKETMKAKLRRDPTDAELAILGDQLSGLYRQQFDGGVEVAQMEDTGAGRVLEGPMQVDPMARFNEAFEQRYAGEIKVVENVDERQQATAKAGMVADSFGSLIGGGA